MRRKKFIATALMLVIIMLMNCIAPVLQVQAATAKTTMSFNSNLYKGLKSYFKENNIKAVYNDGLHTIKMENSAIEEVTILRLEQKAISDITGLENFKNLEKLYISANNLSEKSNLGVLNSFTNLNYLDISSNQISDISDFEELVNRLIQIENPSKEAGKERGISLSNQKVRLVVDVPLNDTDQDKSVYYPLPQILQFSGVAQNKSISDKGYLNLDNWITEKYFGSSNSYYTPQVGRIPGYVTESDNKVEIIVGQDTDNGFIQYQGLAKIEIKIGSMVGKPYSNVYSNLLYQSEFTLYYVVHAEDSEGVIFNDKDFYLAVKDQLTKDQTINSDLLSYKYTTKANGEEYYDVCDIISKSGNTVRIGIDGEILYTITNFDVNGYNSSSIIYEGNSTSYYNRYGIQNYEVQYVDSLNSDGTVSRTAKVKIAQHNPEARNLYEDYYDEPYVLVISDSDIFNKITSLILNDKKIDDLTGLEKFIGLESNLNVSYNYIDTLANIYSLQLNKEGQTPVLQELYRKRLGSMSADKAKVISAYSNVEAKKSAIEEEIKKIHEALEKAGELVEPTPVSEATQSTINSYESRKTAAEAEAERLKEIRNEKKTTLDQKDAALKAVAGYDTMTEAQRRALAEYAAYITAKNEFDAAEEAYNNALTAIDDLKTAYDAAQAEVKKYEDDQKAYEDGIKSAKETIEAANKAIEGDGENNKGLLAELDEFLNDSNSGLNVNIAKMYDRLGYMYETFNKEYKLTTLLTPELNYQTEEEYDELQEKLSTYDGAAEVGKAEFERIKALEGADALSILEKNLIITGLGLNQYFSEEVKTIGQALDKKTEDIESRDPHQRSDWLAVEKIVREIDIYSQATNYCLIKRMNQDTSFGRCYIEEYLEKKINELESEDLNADKQKAIYEKLTTGSTNLSYTSSLYSLFNSYINKVIRLVEGNIQYGYSDKGEYFEVAEVYSEEITNTSALLDNMQYVDAIYLCESLAEQDGNIIGDNKDQLTNYLFFYNQLMNLANKFTTFDEISRYVVLPNLRKLDVRNNKIETLGEITIGVEKVESTEQNEEGQEVTTVANNEIKADLTILKNLKEFYAGHNIVTGDISCVNWEELKTLKKLDLSYNFITDISPLQVLQKLKYLDVSDNLLEGEFNLDILAMPKLKNLILAGNKYSDIKKLIDGIKDIKFANPSTRNMYIDEYLALDNTIKIDLSRQQLEIDITEAIAYEEENSVYEVELPPIFSQLEEIDTVRTAYGTTSSKGSITATGGVAYIPVSKLGAYEGTVKVIAANGYPEDVTTSFGIDTTCTIKYDVKNIHVDAVKIDGDNARIEAGTSRTFTATVEGENIPDETVEWDIVTKKTVENEDGSESTEDIIYAEGTKIDQNGLLTIDPEETATSITIEATSNYDDSVKDTLTIEIYRRTITDIKVTGSDEVVTGKTAEYYVEVNGTDLEDEDKNVTWSILGKTSADTKIEVIDDLNPIQLKDEDGNDLVDEEGNKVVVEPNGKALLTVGADETAEKITVVATSTYDEEKTGTLDVTINKKKITGITINGPEAIRTGNTETYTVSVDGEFLDEEDKAVEWTIIRPYYSDEYNANTKLEEIVPVEGEEIENIGGAKFTVAQDEIIRSFTIRARSKVDGSKYADIVVQVNKKEATKVEVTGTESIVSGKTGEYSAVVTGNYLDDADKTVTWSIKGIKNVKDGENTRETEVALSDATKIDKIEAKEGEEIENVGGAILTVGLHEDVDKIIVVATSDFDGTIKGEFEVTVNRKEITKVRVYEQGVTVTLDGKGKTSQFTEIVEGNYLDDEDKGITWSISGQNSQITTIKPDGTLIVGEDETADEITVIATSNFDNSKQGTSVVKVLRKEVTSVTITEQDVTVRKGRTYKYNAVVEGDNLDASNRTVTWEVKGLDSEGREIAVNAYTKISNNGELTVGVGEEAAQLVIKATSTLNPTVYGTSTATLSNVSPDLPNELGYTIDSDDNVIGVSPDTLYPDFRTKFVKEEGYTVKVFRNGTEISEGTSVATNDVVKIYKEGIELSSNVIVVKGDVNCDGTVSDADTKLVKSHRARIITLTGVCYKAADVNNDKDITITDVKLILAHRGKLVGYTL